ncbi:MAG TPA: PilN domain-containing protein [Longimicrobium sp.]
MSGPRPTRGFHIRPARLALALAPDHLVAVRLRGLLAPRPAEVLSCPLAPPEVDGWPALEEALRDLSRELGVARGTVDVALLRRLAHARVLPLPPVRRGELAALVRRGARRHFAVRDEALVADAVRLPLPHAGTLAPALAACAPAALAETIAAACAAAGFRVGTMVPAAAALAAGVRALVPSARFGRTAVVACTAAGPELLMLAAGQPARIQPLAASTSPESPTLSDRVLAALHGDEELAACTVVAVCGAEDGAAEVREALMDDERFAGRVASSHALKRLPAEAVIALGAARAGGSAPALLPESILVSRTRSAKRRAIAFSAASAVLLASAGAMHLDGVRREVAAVEARRREIREPVGDALEARAAVERVRGRLTTLAALEAASPAWTGEIAALARALPDSAHLRTLTADSAGMRLAGVARSASAVVPALEASRRFERVSLAAPVRWEQGDAGERFDVAAFRAPQGRQR